MTECTEYELEISALLDGESDPGTALDLLEHVGTCRSCGAFVRDVRDAQWKVDRAFDVAGRDSVDTPPVGRVGRVRRMPRWALQAAAAIVFAVGGWIVLDGTDANEAASVAADGEILVRLEEDRGAMTEERFIALTVELLRADRIYRDEMFSVLEAVRSQEASGERTLTEGGDESGEAGDEAQARVRLMAALD